MKIAKRIWLGIGTFVALFFLAAFFGPGRPALAASGFTSAQIQNARVYFVTDKQLDVVIAGQNVEFDGSINGDTGYGTFKPKDSSLFCTPANNAAGGNYAWGRGSFLDVFEQLNKTPLTGQLDTTNWKLSNGVYQPSDYSNGMIGGVLYAGLNSQNCVPAYPKNTIVVSKAGPPPASSAGSAFTSSNIGSIKGSDFKFNDGANITLTFNKKTVSFNDRQPADNTRNFSPASGSFCTNSISGITFNNSDQEKNPLPATVQLAYYDENNNNSCVKKTINVSIPNPNKIATMVLEWNNADIETIGGSLSFAQQSGSSTIYLSDINDICGGGWAVKLSGAGSNSGTLYQVQSGSGAGNIGLSQCSIKSQRSVQLEGTQNTAAPSDQGAQGQTTSADCESNGHGFSLAWVVCPVLQAADSFSNMIIGLFEGQLSFRVSDLGQNNGADGGYSQTKAAWATLRDLASSLLVIFMLIMVLSQAISIGPFDAYTIKKLLPKMVAAIIIMQLSWSLFVWVVGIFDDIGHGLADLMYLPFGGAPNMTLFKLLSNAHIGTFTAGSLSWAVLLGGFAALYFAVLPAALGVATAAILAILAGLFTLIFRKILIIMLLILGPLALVAWILPGTQQYWKMWRENFIKALAMFPIAMAIIAAGRIFAKVAGAQDDGTFISLIFVLVGYFGPLFILPKTFKWGGQAMSMAGNGVMKAKDKANQLPQKYFKARQESWNRRNKARSYERVRNNEKFNPKKLTSYWTTPLDRFGSGQWDPLLGAYKWMPGVKKNSSMRRSKVQQYKEEGHKVQQEEQNLADREAGDDERRLDQEAFEDGGYNHDHFWQDKLAGNLKNYKEHEFTLPDGSKSTYYKRDFAQWQETHPGGTEAQFEASDAYGYKDYDKTVIPVHEPEDKYESNAALNMLAKFGGPNHSVLLSHLWQERFSKDPKRVKEVMEWAQDHNDFILKVYPQFLKGVSSTAGNSSLAGMHPIGFRDELGRLAAGVKNARTPGERANAETLLRRFISNLETNMSSPTRDSIETDIRTLTRAVTGNDTSYLKKINEEITGNDEKKGMRYEEGIIDKDSGLNHPPAIDAEIIREVIGSEQVDRLNSMIKEDGSGGYTSAATGGGGGAGRTADTGGGGGDGGGDGGEPPEPTSPAPEPPEPPDRPRGGGGFPAGRPGGPAPRPTYMGDMPSGSSSVAQSASAPEAESQPAAEEGPSFASESFGSFDPTPSANATQVVERTTREIRTAAPVTQTRPTVEAPVQAAAPEVNVNINSEELGRAFASNMRNVLRNTTLKVDHSGDSPGTGQFTPRQPGEEQNNDWGNLRPPSPPQPPANG